MGDRIAIFNAGYMQQVGTPHEVYNRPVEHLRGHLHRLAPDEPGSRARGASRAISSSSPARTSASILPSPEASTAATWSWAPPTSEPPLSAKHGDANL